MTQCAKLVFDNKVECEPHTGLALWSQLYQYKDPLRPLGHSGTIFFVSVISMQCTTQAELPPFESPSLAWKCGTR